MLDVFPMDDTWSDCTRFPECHAGTQRGLSDCNSCNGDGGDDGGDDTTDVCHSHFALFLAAMAGIEPFVAALHSFIDALARLPGSDVVWRYVKASHQNDPARTALEILLFIFVLRTWMQSRTPGDGGGRTFIKLEEKVGPDRHG
jgi:hypothetical protein